MAFDGAGTGVDAENAYIVTNATEFNQMREQTGYYRLDFPDKTFDLGAETNNDQGAFWNGGSGWNPITSFSGDYFLDGNGHIIDGLFINRPTTEDACGLFGRCRWRVNDLKLTNVNITGQQSTGGFGGLQAMATFDRCAVTGFVSGSNGTGLFAGRSENAPASILNDCYASGSVSCDDGNVGGFIGIKGADSVFNRCWVSVQVLGTSISKNGFTNNSNNVNNCYWNSDAGHASSTGGSGRTTVQLQTLSNYTPDYNMVALSSYVDEIWAIDDGAAYPILGFEVEESPNPSVTITLNGTPLENAFVKFFEMDAFTAAGVTTSTIFQNCAFLSGSFQTNASGIATFDSLPTEGRVVGAMVLHPVYDTQWQFVQIVRIGSDNIDLTAPV